MDDSGKLVSELAVAAVEGAQKHVMAQAKHFALNSVEEDRFQIDMQVDARTLHENSARTAPAK